MHNMHKVWTISGDVRLRIRKHKLLGARADRLLERVSMRLQRIESRTHWIVAIVRRMRIRIANQLSLLTWLFKVIRPVSKGHSQSSKLQKRSDTEHTTGISDEINFLISVFLFASVILVAWQLCCQIDSFVEKSQLFGRFQSTNFDWSCLRKCELIQVHLLKGINLATRSSVKDDRHCIVMTFTHLCK